MKQVVNIMVAAALSAPMVAPGTAQEVARTEVTDGTPEEVVADAAPTLEVFAAEDVALSDFQWLHRPIVVFADTAADPRFQEQMEFLLSRPEELLTRDVVVITDTNPDRASMSDIRRKLRPRGFQLTLIAKDGTVNLRKPFTWDVREISRAIDKMPLRQQEIRERATN